MDNGQLAGSHVRELQPEDEENSNDEDIVDEEAIMLRGNNEFTLANSFWFTVGTLMQQGSDLNPQVKSTRTSLTKGSASGRIYNIRK